MISDAVYESNWLDSPKEMRKGLLLIMIRAQKPVKVTGLGFFTISRNSFKKVSLWVDYHFLNVPVLSNYIHPKFYILSDPDHWFLVLRIAQVVY